MEGQILGNRYELLEKIGGGGMAVVYKAKCKMLNRYVAVKILRSEFTNDEEFVKRFRVEAQSAASLSHPNIVSIYDVGHQDDIHYIIMEYINGQTLKEYITENGALNWKEAVNITIQICSAIEHAHRNHIVHRDIKPHNIMMTKEGIAKVTDFGIARAVSSSTITMVGSTIGSVHYFSPEQARGGYTDEKSDLYSIGIALYEMVTGKVPFNGDTPVAIALKHMQVEPPEPKELNPQVPNGINQMIMKAIKKDQNARYQTAGEFLQDLQQVLKEPEGGFVMVKEDVEDFPTRRMDAIPEDYPEQSPSSKKTNKTAKSTDKNEKKSDKLTIWVAVIASLVIILGLGIFTIAFLGNPLGDEEADEFTVENYVGQSLDEIKTLLEQEGVHIQEIQRNHEEVEAGMIFDQEPAAGRTIKKEGYNNEIKLFVSKGPELIKIPDFRKVQSRQAENTMVQMGLLTRTEEEFSGELAEGLVIRTDPEYGEEVKKGTIITIYRSKGPEIKMTTVPNLIGKTKMDAQRLLSDANLVLGTEKPEQTGNNVIDQIIEQYPSPNTQVKEGTPVNITFEEQLEEPKTKIINETIHLTEEEKERYGEQINVSVSITPLDTNESENVFNEIKKQEDFPLTLEIPVPEEGRTKVQIKLNNEIYAEFIQDELSGR